MGTYDGSKDVVLHSYEEKTEKGKLMVTVNQYNGGVPKVQITRVLISEAGVESYVKLGRLTGDELTSLVTLLRTAQHALCIDGEPVKIPASSLSAELQESKNPRVVDAEIANFDEGKGAVKLR